MKESKDRRSYPNGFYLIDNRISMFRLTPIELAVYNCICRHGNTHHLAHLRMATIANEVGCAVSSARKAAHALEVKQLIDISPDYKDAPSGGKWHGANYYRVLELPSYIHRDVKTGTPTHGAMKKTTVNNTVYESGEPGELPF